MKVTPEADPDLGTTDRSAPESFAALVGSLLSERGAKVATRRYAAGERLYREEEPANALYVIRRGRVKITRCSAAGKESILGFFGPGDFVGCCALLDAARLPCAAEAVEPTEVLYLSRAEFLQLASAHPELAMGALQQVTALLRGSHHKVHDLALDSVERRIVTSLLELDQRFGLNSVNGSRVIGCRITRQDLAQMSGTTVESASRAMSRLRRIGWIRSSRRGIVLVSPAELALSLTR